MGKRALLTKKAVVPPPSTSDDMDTSGSMSDFQILVNALQERYSKKARDQQATFETELKAMVAHTVDTLSFKVTDYEAHLTSQLNTLESELMKIGKERDNQVANFQNQYSSMKKAVETCLSKIGELDETYNETVKTFFSTMKSYRETAAQSRESISKLAENAKSKVTAPSSKRRK